MYGYNSYLPEKSLISYIMGTGASVLHALSETPHLHLVSYQGSFLCDGRVFGLCLKKYREALYQRIDSNLPYNPDSFLFSLHEAVAHLRFLGFYQNEMHYGNIIFAEDDTVVLVDMDCTALKGKLIHKTV